MRLHTILTIEFTRTLREALSNKIGNIVLKSDNKNLNVWTFAFYVV